MSPPPTAASVEAANAILAFDIPQPLNIHSVVERRSKAGRLVAGVAAASDVGLFKGRQQHAHKSSAVRWDHRLNQESDRKPSSIKSAAKMLSVPGIISLGGGLPSSTYFPFEEYSFKVPRVGAFSEAETATSGITITAGKHDQANDTSLYDISTAFNYGQGSGSPQLLRFMVEHTEICHNPPYADWSSTMTIGSTSGVDMIFRMLVQPNMCMLSEEYTFSTAVEAAGAMGIRTVGVKMDSQGLLATSLDSILSNWDPAEHSGSQKPFLLYTVPSGQNPTGATQSLARRKAIYQVAQKHDLLIIEDEPYYFLQMQPYTGRDAPDVPPPASHAEFLSSLVPSMLSLDTDGRVLRLDSFSKVIAPGSRLGWITGPEQLIERYRVHADVSTQGPSGFSQLGLFKLLDEHWGHAGYLDWLIYIRLEYTKRRDVILAGCEDFLPQEICSWKPPMAGMFHWIQVEWRKHPLADKISLVDLEERIWYAAIDQGCLLIRGSLFVGDKTVVQDKMFFRATFGAAPADKIIEAVRRFGMALRAEFGLAKTETNSHATTLTNGNGHFEA